MDSEPDILTDEGLRRYELFRRDEAHFARVARRLAGNPHDAADLVQDLRLRVLRHPTGPADAARFRAWCFGLLRNTATDHRRSAARRRCSDHVGLEALDARADSRSPNPELGVEARRVVDRCESLDELERELVLRRYLLEETASEIARELRSSPPAVRMRLKRLLSKLRGVLVGFALWLASESPCKGGVHDVHVIGARANGG